MGLIAKCVDVGLSQRTRTPFPTVLSRQARLRWMSVGNVGVSEQYRSAFHSLWLYHQHSKFLFFAFIEV